MTEEKAAWEEVGDRLEALALKVKLHAKEELSEDGTAVKNAFERLTEVINQAAEAVSDACHDPAVRDDAREAMSALGRALSKSLERLPSTAK